MNDEVNDLKTKAMIDRRMHMLKHFDALGLPDYMWVGTRLYIERGIQPGDFLSAVICNDLSNAVSRADDSNIRYIAEWVKFFYNYTPAGCWGSRTKMLNWIEAKRVEKAEREKSIRASII